MDNTKQTQEQKQMLLSIKASGKELTPMDSVMYEVLEKNYKIYLKDDHEIGISIYETLEKVIHEAASLAYNRGFIEGRNSVILNSL